MPGLYPACICRFHDNDAITPAEIVTIFGSHAREFVSRSDNWGQRLVRKVLRSSERFLMRFEKQHLRKPRQLAFYEVAIRRANKYAILQAHGW
jgi:hypothetical protein